MTNRRSNSIRLLALAPLAGAWTALSARAAAGQQAAFPSYAQIAEKSRSADACLLFHHIQKEPSALPDSGPRPAPAGFQKSVGGLQCDWRWREDWPDNNKESCTCAQSPRANPAEIYDALGSEAIRLSRRQYAGPGLKFSKKVGPLRCDKTVVENASTYDCNLASP
jgi:hypothetical protein